MPIGGESVGTAFVRIIAEGEGLDKSIRDTFDDSNPEFEKSARRNTKAYIKGWEEEWAKAPNSKRLTDGIRNTLLQGDFLQSSFFRSREWTRFKSGMANTFGDAGRLATKRLEQELLKGTLGIDEVGDRVQNMLGDIARANQDLHKETIRAQKEMLEEAYALNVEFDRKTSALQRDRDVEFERSIKDQQRLLGDLEESFERIIHDTNRLTAGEKTLVHNKRDLIRELGNYRLAMHRAGAANDEFDLDMAVLHRRIVTLNPRINRINGTIGRFADGVGRAFGRGARNDFVNFFGAMVRGLVNTLQIVPRLIGWFLQLGQSIKFAFDETMRNTGSTFRAGMAAVIATLETAGAAAVVMAAGFGLLVVVIGPLTSLLVALAGALSAVVGSLVFGLTAAIVAVGGSLIPLIAGIGVTVAAFKSMDDAAKKALKQDFKPVLNSLRDLGDIAADQLFKDMSEQAEILNGVVERLEPTTRRVAGAIRDLFDEFVLGFQSPFFQQFMDRMDVFLPNAVTKLGTAFNNFFFGFLGFFQAATPLIERFLDWLVQISERFMEWTNSAEGRKEIRQFLKDAGDSAAALGQFLSDAAYFLGQLFTAGQDTGNSLITTLGDKLREWGDFIRENPDAIGNFFKDAEELVKKIGRVIEAVGVLIDKLDNERTRNIAGSILGGITAAMKIMALVAAASAVPLILLSKGFGAVRDAVQTAIGFLRNNWPNSLGEARSAATSARTAIVNAIRGIPAGIALAFAGIAGFMITPFTTAKAAIVQIPGQIVAAFSGLGDRIRAAIGTITVPGIGLLGGGIPYTATGGVFAGAQKRIIGEAGPEAVVPLNRPLSQVDPAVRWLSAIAQGKVPGMASGGIAGGGKTISADGWTIVSNSEDPETVAAEVFNRLVAVGY